MKNKFFNAQLVIPATFEECFTYAQQIRFLYAYIKQVEEAEGGLPADVEERLTALENEVKEIEDQIGDLELDEVTKLLNDVKTEIETLSNTVSNLQSEVQTAQTDINSLTETVTNHGNDLDDLDASVEELKTATTANAAAVETLKTQTTQGFETANTVLEKHETDIADINSEISDLKSNKQDLLSFDSTPTLGSNNPVTSDGIKKAIDAIPGGGGGSVVVDDEVTSTSANPVKSSGIYNFVTNEVSPVQAEVTLHGTEISALKQQAEEAEEGLSGKQAQLYVLDEDGTTQHSISAQVDDSPLGSGLYRLITSAAVYNALQQLEADTQVKLKGAATADVIESVSDVFSEATGCVPGTVNNVPNSDVINQMYQIILNKISEAASGGAIDDTVSEDSVNPVKSSGIYSFVNDAVETMKTEIDGQLADKQDKLTFDDEPTAGSTNPVTSGGVEAAVEALQDNINTVSGQFNTLSQRVNDLDTTLGGEIAGKQDTLTFDNTPTEGSQNPVTSDGIAKAIAASGGANKIYPSKNIKLHSGQMLFNNGMVQYEPKCPAVCSVGEDKFINLYYGIGQAASIKSSNEYIAIGTILAFGVLPNGLIMFCGVDGGVQAQIYDFEYSGTTTEKITSTVITMDPVPSPSVPIEIGIVCQHYLYTDRFSCTCIIEGYEYSATVDYISNVGHYTFLSFQNSSMNFPNGPSYFLNPSWSSSSAYRKLGLLGTGIYAYRNNNYFESIVSDVDYKDFIYFDNDLYLYYSKGTKLYRINLYKSYNWTSEEVIDFGANIQSISAIQEGLMVGLTNQMMITLDGKNFEYMTLSGTTSVTAVTGAWLTAKYTPFGGFMCRYNTNSVSLYQLSGDMNIMYGGIGSGVNWSWQSGTKTGGYFASNTKVPIIRLMIN